MRWLVESTIGVLSSRAFDEPEYWLFVVLSMRKNQLDSGLLKQLEHPEDTLQKGPSNGGRTTAFGAHYCLEKSLFELLSLGN